MKQLNGPIWQEQVLVQVITPLYQKSIDLFSTMTELREFYDRINDPNELYSLINDRALKKLFKSTEIKFQTKDTKSFEYYH